VEAVPGWFWLASSIKELPPETERKELNLFSFVSPPTGVGL
jgi:hypothetical protein